VNAVAAAREMLCAVGASNVGNAWPIRLGIGIHIGQAVAGTVGSPRRKRHLPGRLPDNADDSASLRSYVVQLIPESHWLIADRMDSVLLASHSDAPSARVSTQWTTAMLK
jgi:hypothetical protein